MCLWFSAHTCMLKWKKKNKLCRIARTQCCVGTAPWDNNNVIRSHKKGEPCIFYLTAFQANKLSSICSSVHPCIHPPTHPSIPYKICISSLSFQTIFIRSWFYMNLWVFTELVLSNYQEHESLHDLVVILWIFFVRRYVIRVLSEI